MGFKQVYGSLVLLSMFDVVLGDILLHCFNNYYLNDVEQYNIKVEILELSGYGLYPSVPNAHDMTGKAYTASHLSLSSLSKQFCSYTLSNYIISSKGIIFHTNPINKWKPIELSIVLYDFNTIYGDTMPVRAIPAGQWYNLTKYNSIGFKVPFSFPELNKVVPLRMPMDDCFNHISFEVIPLIGAVHTFYASQWSQLYFHCSTITAALVNLLGVPESRLIVEKTVLASQVLLPWIPYWLPIQSASMKGIANNVTQIITANLLKKQFDKATLKMLNQLRIECISHSFVDNATILSLNDPFRYIVYSSRAGQTSRDVYKEQQLLEIISKVINKSKYRLIVVGSTTSYSTLQLIQASWQRFAKVYSKAIIMMGPHGATFNNMIFTPPDCHIIEFNLLPEAVFDPSIDIRTLFLVAHHAKGNSGKFYNVEPKKSKRSFDIFHAKYMKISPRDVVRTLMLINKDILTHDLLIDSVNLMDIPDLLCSNRTEVH